MQTFSGLAVVLFVGAVIVIYHITRTRSSGPLYGQTMGDALDKRGHDAPPENEVPKSTEPEHHIPPGKRFRLICFLSVWLTGWTFGVGLALTEWLSLSSGDEGYFFLMFWLAIAIPGWFFAAYALIRLFRGDHFKIEFDGDSDGGD